MLPAKTYLYIVQFIGYSWRDCNLKPHFFLSQNKNCVIPQVGPREGRMYADLIPTFLWVREVIFDKPSLKRNVIEAELQENITTKDKDIKQMKQQ